MIRGHLDLRFKATTWSIEDCRRGVSHPASYAGCPGFKRHLGDGYFEGPRGYILVLYENPWLFTLSHAYLIPYDHQFIIQHTEANDEVPSMKGDVDT